MLTSGEENYRHRELHCKGPGEELWLYIQETAQRLNIVSKKRGWNWTQEIAQDHMPMPELLCDTVLGETWISTLPGKKPTIDQSHDTTQVQLGELMNIWDYLGELVNGYHGWQKSNFIAKSSPQQGWWLWKAGTLDLSVWLAGSLMCPRVSSTSNSYCLYIFGEGETLGIQEILGTSWDFWTMNILFQQSPLECFESHWVSLWWKGSIIFKQGNALS